MRLFVDLPRGGYIEVATGVVGNDAGASDYNGTGEGGWKSRMVIDESPRKEFLLCFESMYRVVQPPVFSTGKSCRGRCFYGIGDDV